MAGERAEVWQGTLALMIVKTLQAMGDLHGYGIARRIEQVSGARLIVNYGTIYPALLKLEQEGYIASSWGIGQQPQGQVLPADAGRRTAGREGNARLAARHRHSGAFSRAGRALVSSSPPVRRRS